MFGLVIVSSTDACPPGTSAAVGVAGLSVTADAVPVPPEPDPVPDAAQYAVAEPAATRTSRSSRISGIPPRSACFEATLILTTPGIRRSRA